MAEASQIETIGDLRTQWRQWTAVVRLVASREERRYAFNPDEYHALHADLLRFAQAAAGQSDAMVEPIYRELEDILTPWVSLDSLVWAEQEIVSKLLARCLAAQQVLDGRPAIDVSWRPSRFTLTLVAMTVVVILLLWLISSDLVSLDRLGAPPWFRRLARMVGSGGSSRRLIIFGVVAMLGGIVLVWRSVR